MKVTYQESFPLSLINESDREFQPRLDYDEAVLEALSKDIAKNGQHNPVGLRKKNSYYQVIYGFQRVLALKKLGWEIARANIYEDATWEELHEQSISNNERHLDLGDLEKALYAKALQEKGFSIPRLCELFGVNKSAIYNLLTVADLDDSTKECLHRRLITLNHGVELARYTDVSKRLETLIMVLNYSWSVRDLKKWLIGKEAVAGGVGTLGDVELCPRYISRVFIEKPDTEDELKARGFGEGAIRQALSLKQGTHNCEECEYFKGLTRDWFVQCTFDMNTLLHGIKELVELSRLKWIALHSNPESEDSRRKWWGHLVKPDQNGVILIGLSSLRSVPAIFCQLPLGIPSWSIAALKREVEQSNKYLEDLQKQSPATDNLEDKRNLILKCQTIVAFVHNLQQEQNWSGKYWSILRKIGEIMAEIRIKHGSSMYQLFATALREGESCFEEISKVCDERMDKAAVA